MKVLVAYDGTLHAKRALRYATEKVRSQGGEVLVVQVFDRSLFLDYDAGPRAEAMARTEFGRHLDEARRIAAEASAVMVRFESAEGKAEDIVLHRIAKESPDLALVTRPLSGLARRARCPVRTFPGTILVPLDKASQPPAMASMIAEEARADGSRIVLVGIVPVHLYSREEKGEVVSITAATSAAVRKLREELAELGMAANEVMRSGYPDEEILKAAEEYDASLIMLPTGGTTPSEVSKAAAIIADEGLRLRWPIRMFSLDSSV